VDGLYNISKVSKEKFNNFIDNFKNVATKLAENIFQSVSGEMNEKINKEMSRRKELRFHVELFKVH
jgi:DNA gyrase/topoisomerase IV subunit B